MGEPKSEEEAVKIPLPRPKPKAKSHFMRPSIAKEKALKLVGKYSEEMKHEADNAIEKQHLPVSPARSLRASPAVSRSASPLPPPNDLRGFEPSSPRSMQKTPEKLLSPPSSRPGSPSNEKSRKGARTFGNVTKAGKGVTGFGE